MNFDLDLKQFWYNLPEERIAKHPLENRSDSQLLLFTEGGDIKKDVFKNLDHHLSPKSTLFFNNTRVIPARLHLYKETGAHIEVFLLEPYAPTTDVASAMLVEDQCIWKCMVGNYKKWKDGQVICLDIGDNITLKAQIFDRGNQHIQFSWNGHSAFVDVLQKAGKIPLPPYIKRELNDSDKERYQTVYSRQRGAVAAPTAGLHFDDHVLQKLTEKQIKTSYLTLHVSAGTFQPIKVDDVVEHPMHHEQVEITKENVEYILKSDQIISVGTTSMRTLESLYWYGVDLIKDQQKLFDVKKLRPYQSEGPLPSKKEVCQAILHYMEEESLDKISGSTEIFILPGYPFKICDGLITNFHLPGSTLILLVAAFIGEDWKKVYDYALKEDFRFLSYGDSSLLMRKIP